MRSLRTAIASLLLGQSIEQLRAALLQAQLRNMRLERELTETKMMLRAHEWQGKRVMQ